MAVTVRPRLGEILRARSLTVAELERQIERRYGLRVDRKTLHRLTYREPVERVDLEVAGAAAAVLSVGLGELFEVDAVAQGSADERATELSAEAARRMAELFDAQARRPLTAAEVAEIEGLVAEWGRLLIEALARARAARERTSLAAARTRSADDLARARDWWRNHVDDERWRRRLTARVRGRRIRAGLSDEADR